MVVIGLDVGTTGVKSTVINNTGKALAYAYQEYSLVSKQKGFFEVDIRVLKTSIKKVLLESITTYGKSDIRAICATSFGESIVLLGENNEILADSMTYMDERGNEEVEDIKDKFSLQLIAKTTGLLPHPMYTAGKIKWIVDHNKDIIAKTKKIHFIADYALSILGGEHITDCSLASRSMFFDVVKKKWWNELIDYIGINFAVLPKITETGNAVGNVSKDIAQELGLGNDVRLILGGHDQITNAIGTGVLETGNAMNGIGTVDCLTPAFSLDEVNPKMAEYNYPTVPYIKNLTVTYALNFSGGSILKWFRDNFAKDLPRDCAYELLNKEAIKQPSDLLIFPYFAGSGTPYMDLNAKAAILGLRLSTDRGTLFRAILEGESYEIRYNLECLNECGIEVNNIVTVGGGSKSKLWMQIRSDIFNKTITVPDVNQAGTMGSAMLGFVNIGMFSDLFEAKSELIKTKSTYHPNKENVDLYDEFYLKYKKVLKFIQEIMQ